MHSKSLQKMQRNTKWTARGRRRPCAALLLQAGRVHVTSYRLRFAYRRFKVAAILVAIGCLIV